MRFKYIHCLAFSFLILNISLAGAKRGGGGDGSSDSGGSDSSSGGSSSETSEQQKQKSEQCKASVREQDGWTYRHPGSYYNGSLTITHNIRDTGTPSGFDIDRACSNGNLGTKTYSFPDAVLHIGPPLDANDTNAAYWALRAFIPFRQKSDDSNSPGAKREVVRLQSAAYEYDVRGVYRSNKDRPVQCWDTRIKKDESDSSFNITSRYQTVARIGRDSGDQWQDENTYQGKATANWITLKNICTRGFTRDPSSVDGRVDITQWDNADLGMAFFETGPSASISGIGTTDVQFALANGILDCSFIGAASYDPCMLTTEANHAYFWYRYESDGSGTYYLLNRFDMNLTATFSMKFQGKLQTDRSWDYVNGTQNQPEWNLEKQPQIVAGSGRRIGTGRVSVYLTISYMAIWWWYADLIL